MFAVLLNEDLKKDFKLLCVNDGLKQKDVAEKAGLNATYIAQIFGSSVLKDSFVKLLEACGYDLKIEYIRRE